MPTNTSNAIGMERQFSPSQQDVYQKQLQGVRSNTAGDLESRGGYRLARALGLVGGTLINEAKRMEVHNQRKSEYAGNYAESKNVDKFRSIQAILANAGMDEYADNPYTRAAIARAEGGKAMAELDNRYKEEVIDVHGYCNSQKEELDRYNKFIADHKHEYSLENTPISAEYSKADDHFFDEGMYANYQNYATGKLSGQEAQAAENRKVIRNATMNAQLDRLASPEYVASTSLEQRKKDLAGVFGNGLDMGSTLMEVTSAGGKFLETLAQTNGGADEIMKYGDVVAYKDPDGKDMLLKDILPMESYHGMAIIQDGNLLEKDITDMTDALYECNTVDELDQKAEELRKKNPHAYTALAQRGVLTSLRENARQKEEQAEREQEQGMMGGGGSGESGIAKYGETVYNNFKSVAKGYLDACMNHQADYQGRPISDALGVFATNKKGEKIFVKANKEDVINFGNEMLGSLLSGKYKSKDALNYFDVLVTAPGFAPFRQSLAESMNATLNGLVNLDIDKIDKRSNQDLQNLQLAMDLIGIDPVGAKQMYGAGNWSRLSVLHNLVPSSEGYWEFNGGQAGSGLVNAIRNYGSKIATIGTDPAYSATKQSLSRQFSKGVATVRTFTREYDITTKNVPIASMPSYVKTQAIDLATMYRLCGTTTDAEAVSKAAQTLAKQYGVYGGVWIPLVKLKDVPIAEKNKAPAVRLMIEQTKKNINWNHPENVIVTWDDAKQALVFSDSSIPTVKNVENLANQIQYIENEHTKAVKAQEAQRKANVQKQTQRVKKEAKAFNKAHKTNKIVEKNKHRKGRQF